MDNLIETVDPGVFIEEQYDGYVRYRNVQTGARWEVHGSCNKCGECLVGAVIDGVQVTSLEEARILAEGYTGKDVPVTPAFIKVCDVFTYNVLENA
jgi:hypothetical protein